MADNKIIYGLIGLITLLAGFGGSQLLSQDQIDHAYVCTTNQNLAFFDRLSSTSKTGYYTENGTLKSIICTNGIWVKLTIYANQKNISVELFKEPIPASAINLPIQYKCTQTNCTRIQ